MGDVAPLSSVLSFLDASDPADLLSRLAALQLMPENASRTLRLQAGAFAACCLPPSTAARPMSTRKFQQLVNGDPLESLLGLFEDPHFGPFTESMFFQGGEYVVLPGLNEDCVYVARALSGGMFLLRRPFSQPVFAQEAFRKLKALLLVSTAMCRKAGLRRGLAPGPPDRFQTALPSKDSLARLRAAVTFSLPELGTVLASQGLLYSDIAPFVREAGSLSIVAYRDTSSCALAEAPLLRCGDRVIVASPSDLLAAWLQWVVRTCQSRGMTAEIAERFSAGVRDRVLASLEHLGLDLMPDLLPPAPANASWKELLHSCDMDKAVYTSILTDPLTPPEDPAMNLWHPVDVESILTARLAEVERHMFTTHPRLNEVMHVVVLQTVGRPGMFGVGDDPKIEGDILLLPGRTLDTIAHLDHDNPLALRQFAKAKSAADRTTEFGPSSVLDMYDLFRKHDKSFYISDDTRPASIMVQPGGGDALHLKVIQDRDHHGAVTPEGTLVEVATVHDGGQPPIYSAPRGPRHGLVIEAYLVPIWFQGAGSDAPSYLEIAGRFLDLLSFWFCEIAPTLGPLLHWDQFPGKAFRFTIDVVEPDRWHTIPDEHSEAVENCVECVRTSSTGLCISVKPALIPRLAGSDNTGERELLGFLLRNWRELFPEIADQVTDRVIEEMIARHAPLGLKKKFLILKPEQHIALRHDSPVPHRHVQPAVEHDILDFVGERLMTQHGYRIGELSTPQEGVTALNAAVQIAATRLEQLLATLHPLHLVDYLLAMHESLIRNIAFTAATLPTRLACFHTHDSLAAAYREQMMESNQAAVSLRFIIECTAAAPPKGLRPMSLTVFDELMALASVIASFGRDSDMLHSGLIDLQVGVLPSRRIGVNRESVNQKHQAQALRWASGEIGRQTRRWQSSPRQRSWATTQLRQAFSDACMPEFGFTWQELVNVVNAALDMESDSEIDAVVRVERSAFIDRIATKKGMTPDRVEAVLARTTLSPRRQLWKPDEFATHEIYPWRFTRQLSFARRPFIAEPLNGVASLVWGRGHLERFLGHFQNIVLSGRIEPSSHAMRQVVGQVTSAEGREFVDLIAGELESQGFSPVRKHVKKIGKLRIQSAAGLDLGDIDVLVADPIHRRIFILECKDLETARTPWELVRERALLLGPIQSGLSTMEKHERRTDWIRANLDTVVEWLDLPARGTWKIVPAIVSSTELFGPAFGLGKMRVISFEEIVRFGLGTVADNQTPQ